MRARGAVLLLHHSVWLLLPTILCILFNCTALTNFQCKSFQGASMNYLQGATIVQKMNEWSWKYGHNEGSILNPRTTVATLEEEAAVFSPRQQPKPKQAALRVSSSCGQTAVVGGGAVWWCRENSPKNPVDLFSESEQAAAAGQCVLPGSCQRSYCSTKPIPRLLLLLLLGVDLKLGPRFCPALVKLW